MTERWVGRPVLRREDDHILRGRATYVDNLAPPGMLHLVAVRSPFAHARLGAIDASEALESPGTVAVLTGADLDGNVHPMPINRMPDAETAEVPIPLLAAGTVRFAGEPVAAVVAETRAAAMDAAELVRIDYDPLPAVVDTVDALRGDVVLHEALGHNVLLRWRRTAGDVEGSFERAHRIVDARFHIPRLVAAPIEVRGALAEYDAKRDLLTMWLSAQDPHRPMRHLAAVLGRDPERIRMVVRDVGGAFGSKGTLAPEGAVAAIAAMRLSRPVKWVEDRSENFLASYQGRGQDAEIELAVDADGRFLAVRARLVADVGAYLYPTTPAVPVTTAMLVTGAYEVPAVDVETVGVATNKVPTGPYRGAGRPEAAYVAERIADLAAAEVGLDPVEIRRRNFIPPERFPYESPLGYTFDSGNYARALDRACDVLGYDAVRTEQRAQRDAGRVVGVGLSTFVERAGAGNWESGAVEVEPGGRIVVRVGSTPHGQGHHTVFAQIAADALGVHPDDVEVRTGDTAEIPEGVGSFASRSVTVGGSAVVEAAGLLEEKARLVAAHVLGADPEDVRWEDGCLRAGARRREPLLAPRPRVPVRRVRGDGRDRPGDGGRHRGKGRRRGRRRTGGEPRAGRGAGDGLDPPGDRSGPHRGGGLRRPGPARDGKLRLVRDPRPDRGRARRERVRGDAVTAQSAGSEGAGRERLDRRPGRGGERRRRRALAVRRSRPGPALHAGEGVASHSPGPRAMNAVPHRVPARPDQIKHHR